MAYRDAEARRRCSRRVRLERAEVGLGLAARWARGVGLGSFYAFHEWLVGRAAADRRLDNGLGDCDVLSPLILDLDGDGVEADGLAYFDHEGDGWGELSRWAGEDDGVLVWDRNRDGVINDGSELFGNNTVLRDGGTAKDGFAALSDLDDNGDGVIDGKDGVWVDLRVMRWTDANGDGVRQDGESVLVTLGSLGIGSLGTDYVESSRVDGSGNEHRQVGSFSKTDGTTGTMTDVWLMTSPAMSSYDRTGIPVHSVAVGSLPDVSGGGRVYGLHDAMALDDAKDGSGNSCLLPPYYGGGRTEVRSLREMVSSFVATDAEGDPRLDRSARLALAEQILLRWAGAEGVRAQDYGADELFYTEAHKLAVVEAFQGEQWHSGRGYRGPSLSAAQKVERGYQSHLERLYGQLMLESHLGDLQKLVKAKLKEGAEAGSTNPEDYTVDFSAVAALLSGGSDARRGEWLRSIAALYGSGENSAVILSSIRETAPDWVYEYQYYAEYLERGVYDGDVGGSRDEFIGDCGCGGGLRDNVFRTTDGGADRLEGRGGDDTYHLGYGTGHDRIEEGWRDSDFAGDGNDVIKVAPGISTERVKLSRTRDDLVVSLLDEDGGVESSLTVADHYANAAARVEKVLFSDGTVWGSGVLQLAFLASGRGGSGVDTYDGGGVGVNAVMQGGEGSDVYWLGRGSGHDRIDEAAYNRENNGDTDIVRLRSGLTAEDVRLSRTREDLVISVLSSDKSAVDSVLTVANYYATEAAKVERVELHDGTLLWSAEQLDAVALADAGSGDDELTGTAGSDVMSGHNGGDDTLRGGGGSDVYWFGRGSGNDTVDEGYRNFGSAGDVVRLRRNVKTRLLSLSRDKYDLIIRLRGAETLTIKNYYVNDAAKIERVERHDGTLLWDSSDFAGVRWTAPVYAAGGSPIRGRTGVDYLNGLSGTNDVFDSNAGGNDILRGRSGDDVYWLGRGTGHDIVDDDYQNAVGDAGDVIKIKAGIGSSSVRLVRSNDGEDLFVQLLDTRGRVSDSLKVDSYYTKDGAKIERLEFSDGKVWDAGEFMRASLRGGLGGDYLNGLSGTNDVFDGAAGGNDTLRGRGGDDVYWLGRGTGHDVIDEDYQNAAGDSGDVIKIKAGIGVSSVRLSRSNDGKHLFVQLLDGNGRVTDSLKVDGYYTSDSSKVERVEFMDGTVWDADTFMRVAMRGGVSGDYLEGLSDADDVFDSSAGGNDTLRGRGGDDVYWLGRGTGHDVVNEGYGNSAGDSGDEIRVKAGIASSSVRLMRSNDGRHLFVQLLDGNGRVSDSLKVEGYYTGAKAKVERVRFVMDGTIWDANDFMGVAIRGGASGDYLEGLSGTDDVFDGDMGGNDTLRGRGGDDVYWLGKGTGHDVVNEGHENAEGDGGDVIRIKVGIAPSSVRLVRSNDGRHLFVQLLDARGRVSDSLRVENYYADDSAKVERVEFMDGAGGTVGTVWDANDFMRAAIRGLPGGGNLYGLSDTDDVFDSDAGSNDILRGRGGDDVYWLGKGTDHDVVDEGYENDEGDAGDVIRIKAGIAPSSVRLLRSDDGRHLFVQLLGADGRATDSLKVDSHYANVASRVERLEFMDGAGGTVGTVWDENDLMGGVIRGGAGDDNLEGLSGSDDVFDSDAGGNDLLRGRSGDDVYWLGYGTGHDTILEWFGNIAGDSGDVIRIKAGIAPSSVRLARSGDRGRHLIVQLLGTGGEVTDSLTVENYHESIYSEVERLEFMDGVGGTVGTVWDAEDFTNAPMRGGAGDDYLKGKSFIRNVFDGDAGGNDRLVGRGDGVSVYWLGRGTGHDIVYNRWYGYTSDVIRIKAGIAPSSVRLVRSGDGEYLYVQLLNTDGEVTDSLRIDRIYHHDTFSGVERVEFMDGAGGTVGTVWDAEDFMRAPIRGGTGDDELYGLPFVADMFDGTAGGNDILRGRGNDDVYWLGKGTGHDTVDEGYGNADSIHPGDDVIRIKPGIAPSSVRLARSDDGKHLFVQLLGADGRATDSLKVDSHYANDPSRIERVEFMDGEDGTVGTVWDANDFMRLVIRGGGGDDELYGLSHTGDVFDGDAGGNDTLRGRGGDDVYWLGKGTGHDTVDEGYENDTGDAGDVIRMKAGIAPSSVRLARSDDGKHLFVQLLGANRTVTDLLKVENYYADSTARIERVEFMDGTVWDANDFMQAAIRGGAGGDSLEGLSGRSDVFDSDAGGNDMLHGRSGDDVYWLGRGTGHDIVDEGWSYSHRSAGGDDVIRIKPEIAPSSVRLVRSDGISDLYVQLLNASGDVTDSLTVKNHYYGGNSKIERVEFMDGEGGSVGTVWDENDFMRAPVRGGTGDDYLGERWSLDTDDVFDSDAGGNDWLYGGRGNNVYWLGRGTGHDIVHQHYWKANDMYPGDVIRIKPGIAPSSARFLLSANGKHLLVQLLGTDGEVTDSLRVQDYYTSTFLSIERVEFMDGVDSTVGTVWNADDFMRLIDYYNNESVPAVIRGGSDDEGLVGSKGNNVFDSDAGGNDSLHGRGGDDVYWLGRGTGRDTIYEWWRNGVGDTGDDVIRIKPGIAPSSVRLVRLGYVYNIHYHSPSYDRNLYVQLLGADGKVTDSLTVDNYYADDRAKVERVEFMDGEGGTVGTVWDADDLMQVAIRGVDRRVKDLIPARGPSHFNDQTLFGVSGSSDVFDSAAGRHHLYGATGDDVYWLGRGTGHDTVYEYWRNRVGDAGDVIKIKSGIVPSSVRLLRSDSGVDLRVQLLDTDGDVTDSLTVSDYYVSDIAKIERVEFMDGEGGTVGTIWDADDFAQAAIRGGDDDDKLYGLSRGGDVFDSVAGGDDTLYGRGGDDVYWLGKGTGHDTIVEWYENGAGDTNDVIRIKSGITPSSVRLSRSEDGVDFLVQLLDADGKVTDSLTVSRYYTDETAKVERVEFMDGEDGTVSTVWDADDFVQAAIRDVDKLYGFSGRSDVFDSGAGDDTLYGRSGDDVYWLGYGTGRDTINEGYQNAGGDANDVIRIKPGIAPSSVRLVRSDRNDYLHIQLLDTDGKVSDSLTVEHHYTTDNAKIERVEFMDGEGGTVGTVWDADDFAQVAMRGRAGQFLYAVAGVDDVFDSAEGGDNRLHGHSGDDVYWLGYGTGHDTILEWFGNVTGDTGDVIRVKPGIAPSSVRLARSDDGRHLLVQLLGTDGRVSDSLTVDRHYTADRAKIERVEFMDGEGGTVGTIWDADDFAQATIRGAASDNLYGLPHTDDIFDSDVGGDDRLHGYGGNDVYWLGHGTGDDVVLERWRNPKGDDGDVIRIKAGIAPSSVRMSRVEEEGVSHLLVQLLDKDGVATDSLRVDRYYTDETAKIERIEFMDGADDTVGTVWDANDLMLPVAIRGGGGDERLYGSWRKDAFDSDAGGNDRLYGRGGDDAYWLGRGTGHDIIDEGYGNVGGDAGDVIRIKSGIAPSSVRLVRSGDGKDLVVQLLAANGKVSDSLRVENHYVDDAAQVERVEFMDGAGGSVGTVWYADDLMRPAAIRGGDGDDRLYGSSVRDVFDSDAGGNDSLYGYGGDDVYWLGRGTGHDVVDESYRNVKGDAGDVIRIKAGIAPSSVRLLRSDDGHLLVRLLDADGKVSDSLTVRNYYRDDAARVEQVKFMDGTVWGADDLMRAAIRGGAGNDILEGLQDSGDVFDGEAGGNDLLRGRSGDDVYWLGRGTGHDTIDESYENAEGGAGDVIRMKPGIAPSSVRLVRSDDGKHFLVQLLDAGGEVTDSLTVENYYTDETARIERVEFMDGVGGTVGTVWDAEEFMRVAIRGGVDDDRLYGLSWRSDAFDSDAGGDDRLRGRSGDDVYWLGRGTGHDIVDEGYQNAIGDTGDVIRIKPGIVPSSVRLACSDDGKHLFVQLLDADGKVSDSLTVENYYTDGAAKIERVEFMDGAGGTVGTVWGDRYFPLVVRGNDGDDQLYGSNGRDVFDGEAGGNDLLRGRSGNDVYWLGYGTGHDTIDEGYENVGGDAGDVIRIKSGIAPSSIRLVRSDDGEDLIVQLLDTDGNMSDSLTVENYYTDNTARIEQVKFMDGTVWDADDLMRPAAILGGVGDDQLHGSEGRDVFDSDTGGDDRLRGRSGDDVYWLGRGTGHDTIDEGHENVGGDAGDVIRIKSGIAPSSIRLVRSDDGEDLIVQLLDTDGKMSDSLTVENYYTDNTARIEQVKFMDGTVWDADDLMRPAAILGGAGDDQLHGSGGRDVFDSDAGGNDDLHGRGGDDVYWLGRGTGHDFIDEGYENAEGDAGDIIRIKPGIAPSSVRFLRSYDGKHLFVRLLDTDGEVSDSLTVENYYADGTARIEQIKFMDGVGGLVGTVWDTDDFDLPVRGGVGHDWLYGSGGRDVFDSDAGGDDRLHGRGGDDVYWLGRGTGHDTIDEGYENVGGDSGDVIRIKPGIAPSSVRLVRSDDGEDLVVGLLDTDGEVTDSLTIENYYTDGTAQVERVEFMDGAVGTVWHADDLMRPAAILGGVGDDRLYGLSWRRDLFDSDVGGDDRLYGRGGDDVYWLGRGTGHDTIDEGYENIRGDAGDVIRIKFGIAPSSVRLVRSYDGKHLFVRLLDINGGMTDSLKVENYYTDNAARIEQVEFMDGVDGAVGTVWHANDLMRPAAILGSAGNDWLYGSGGRDVFDSDAGGDDRLHGRGGDDVYWLGYGTGHDTIDEGYENVGGDSGDVIRIKPGIAPSSVRLVRSDDGRHLFVRLLDVNGGMTDSLKVENYYTDNAARIEQVVFMDGVDGLVGTVWHADDLMRPAAILGSAGNDQLHGSEGRDVFDSDAGGNDRLHGRGGDDVYWLGRGTGYDTIDEGYENAEGDAGDVIRIKPGIAPSSVRLARSDDGRHLFVRLFDTISGEATDLLKVENYYTDNTARIEQVVFMDGVGGLVGTVWDADDFVRVPIRGGFGHDWLYGSDGKDVFDSDAGGNDDLHGRGGDDVYWLGYGTGHDTIDEGYENVEGDAGDVIRIKSGIAPSSVRLARSDDGRHLFVRLFDTINGEATDSLKVENYYTDNAARIEQVEFMDGTVWDANDLMRPAAILGGCR